MKTGVRGISAARVAGEWGRVLHEVEVSLAREVGELLDTGRERVRDRQRAEQLGRREAAIALVGLVVPAAIARQEHACDAFAVGINPSRANLGVSPGARARAPAEEERSERVRGRVLVSRHVASRPIHGSPPRREIRRE
jgi:hypothetical protein